MDRDEISFELARSRLEDAQARLRYQQEFSVEGFKTLVLINGGAIVGLLTFAGNRANVATNLTLSFAGFTTGLILAVVAYLAAYVSQAELMQMDMHIAYNLLGLKAGDAKSQDERERRGMIAVRWGIALSLCSLAGFIGGSWAAIAALS